MSITSASLVRCDVHLTHQHYYPGDAVEGAVVMDAAAAVDVCNVHIKVVGKEEVYAMVDQVKQSRVKDVQFGISSQDYVYFRELVTLAGALVTEKKNNKKDIDGTFNGGDGSDEPTHREVAVEVTDEGDEVNVLRYNESICAHPGVVKQNQSFAVSRLAAEEGVSVRFPAGHYVYPFRFLLPTALPPNYDTGICVKDGQFSNSQAALRYYVKIYVWSPSRIQIASARADFVVGAMQPTYCASQAAGTVQTHSRSNSYSNKIRCKDGKDNSGNAATSLYGGSRAKLPSPSSAGKTVQCVFPVMGTCSCFATDAKLKVAFTIAAESFQIGRDSISVTCAVSSNTSSKVIRGVKVQLVQILDFKTTAAVVTMRKTIVEKEVLQPVQPGESGTISVCTSVLDAQEHRMPTMTTSGLEVRYGVRVELLATHVDQASYEFEEVQLTGPVLAAAVPPVGPLQFTALPRGRLTKREAYYAIPTNPSEPPLIASLAAPLSLQGSRAASRRASRLNSLAATPQ